MTTYLRMEISEPPLPAYIMAVLESGKFRSYCEKGGYKMSTLVERLIKKAVFGNP